MIEIPIAAIPNQTFTLQIESSVYNFGIYLTDGVMSVDLVRDGTVILTGERVMANYPVIPYAYLEDGNFVFTTADDEYPDYTKFGTDQHLIYVSQAELGSIRAGT